MAAERLVRILSSLSAATASSAGSRRLCDMAVDVIGVSGAGIMFVPGDLPGASLCSSNEVSKLIEDLQYTFGEGPCVDAHNSGRPVYEPDLAGSERPRWPAFTPNAVEAGALAIFGFPLRVGDVRLGALNVYRDRPGPLTDDQHADALIVADVIARAILAIQADASPGEIDPALEDGADLRLVVHQAAGMISVQASVTVVEAMVRLRAYAFRTGRSVNAIADDIVARRMRFDDGPAA